MNSDQRREPEHPTAEQSIARNRRHWGDAGKEDLASSLTELSGLSSARLGLEDLLIQVASFAVRAIPGADGAGLTLLEPGRSDTVVKTAPFVREIEDIQYSIGQGPCISAAATGQIMRSGSIGGDSRWPRFGPRVGRLGVHSVLSLPLLTAEGVLGALDLYARPKDAFDDRAEHIGQLFAAPAAIAAQNAQTLAQTQRLAHSLQAALTTRAVIDQAIGIIISRSGIDADAAYTRIRTLSQKEHIKVSRVASQIVEASVRRARARSHRPDSP